MGAWKRWRAFELFTQETDFRKESIPGQSNSRGRAWSEWNAQEEPESVVIHGQI